MRIDSLYSTRTYGGVLEGCPTRNHCLERFKKSLNKQWGERKTIVLGNYDFSKKSKNPIDDPWSGFKEDCYPKLPEYTYGIWLNFSTDDYKKGDGKELVVIWFSDDAPDSKIDFDKLFEGKNLFEEAEYFEH